MQTVIIQTKYAILPVTILGEYNQTVSSGTSLYSETYGQSLYPATLGFTTQQYFNTLLEQEAFDRFCRMCQLLSKCTHLLIELYDNPDALKEALETIEQIAEYQELCQRDLQQSQHQKEEPKQITTKLLPTEVRPYWGLEDYE